jgi:hypothetical protein
MSATTEVIPSATQKLRPAPAPPLGTRLRTRLHRQKLDRELALGADPNIGALRKERARELVGEECRRTLAASLERLSKEADAPPRPLTSRVPIARAAIRDSICKLETIVERLKAPAYISPRGVAIISALLADGAGPLYGNDPYNSQALPRVLEAAIDCLDNGPVLVG